MPNVITQIALIKSCINIHNLMDCKACYKDN